MNIWHTVVTATLGTAVAAVILMANYDKPPHHQPTRAAIAAVTATDIDWYYESAFNHGNTSANPLNQRTTLGPATPPCVQHQPQRPDLTDTKPASSQPVADSRTKCTPADRARHARAKASADSLAKAFSAVVQRNLGSDTYRDAENTYRHCMRDENIAEEQLLRAADPGAAHWTNPQLLTEAAWGQKLVAAHQVCAPPLQDALDEVHRISREEFELKHEVTARNALRRALAADPQTPQLHQNQ